MIPILIVLGIALLICLVAFINDPQGHAAKEHKALMKIEQKMLEELNKPKRNLK
jgi:hypothetical protein